MKKILSIVLLIALLGQGCSKKCCDMVQGPASGSIYVTGDDGVNPIVWTNGQAQKLDINGGFGSQVVVAGSDLYVGGVSDEDPYSQLTPAGIIGKRTYWKNGAETTIGSAGMLEAPVSITVLGNDVYYSAGTLYKNGSVVSLQGTGSIGHVVASQTVGEDIYLAGYDSVGDGAYWKNGSLHVFFPAQSPGSTIQIYCMYVTLNGDVYVGGTDVQQHGAIWKNGVETMVQSSGGALPLFNVRAIFVDGTDVYSISNLVTGSTNSPAYWKNGVQVNLPLDGANYGNANSIFVSGNDVYVAGTTSQGAVLWKDGVATLLAAGGEANSVVVQ